MAASSGPGWPLQNAFEDFLVAPVTSWAHAFSPVFNPQVIISENSDDAFVEAHVLSRAGSYGRQLGQIIDALDVLIARTLTDRAALTPQENRAIDDLRDLSRTVDEAVGDYRGSHPKGVGKSDVDAVLEGLARLRHTDPQAHNGLVQQLRRYVDAAS